MTEATPRELTEPSAPPRAPASTSTSAIGEAGVERLSLGVIWAYSSPRIGIGIMMALFATYLMKFATDVLLIAPAAMGAILFGSRLWDAVSDPLAGYLSDRTRSRVGRRRIWMYSAAIPMGVGLVMVWSPPLGLSGASLAIWMAVALLVYETANTAFYVPHSAMGVELTPNYHERTRLFGWSHMISAFGMVLGIGSLQLVNLADDKRSVAFALSVVAGITVSTLVLWTTRLLPERSDFQGRGGSGMLKSFKDVFRNEHARLVLIVYAIETFGFASLGMLFPYLAEYVIPMKETWVWLLLAYMIPQFAFTPMWMALSRRVAKNRLWLASMSISALAFGAFFLVEEAGPVIWGLAFVLGVAGGCGQVVAPSIKADIIDYDEYLTGERKEGVYLAVWNLVRKAAGSVTALVAGLVLQFADFQPNVEQTEEVKLAIQAIFSLLPASCFVIGILIFSRFRFNEEEHAKVRLALDARAG